MINGRTYYDILGLDKYGMDYMGRSVSQESIDRRYKALKFGNSYEERYSDWQMPPVEEAYRVLSNVNLRKEYDAKLRNGGFTVDGLTALEESVQAPEEPVQAPEEPVQAPKESVQAPEEPVQAPKEPVQAPEEPVQAPKESVQAPEEPVQAPKESVQAPKESVQAPEEPVIDSSLFEVKRNNRKKIAKGAAIILGSTLFFGPIGTIVSSVLIKKSGKFKLQKLPKVGILKEVKTLETSIINESNQKLQDEITTLLEQPLNSSQRNYKLEIAKLKYKNNIELLNNRIQHKQNSIDQLGMKAHNRLHLFALEKSLEASILWLNLIKKVNEKKSELLDDYAPKKGTDALSKVNKEISELRANMSKEGISKSELSRSKIRLRKLNAKRLATIEKMSLNKNTISGWQVVKAVFGPKQEEHSRTR